MEFILIVVGLLLGPVVNFAIYQFAYFPRPISPWQRSASNWKAKLPILGWLFRAADTQELGRWFWLRPMLLEIAYPISLWLLYQKVMSAGLIHPGVATPVPGEDLFANFLCLAILLSLLIVATFIDFDERTIPDLVTVPGTCVALIGSVLYPNWRLQEVDFNSLQGASMTSRYLQANSSFDWPFSWTQEGEWGLVLGISFWLGWCFALLNRQWILRRGWGKAWTYFWAILARDPWTRFVGGIAAVGAIGIIGVHWFGSYEQWESLLSALFGIGFGGMLVWSFRIVAALVMGKEALGFGDVTLMAMVGAFVGWQVVWISFFVSPFFALLFVVLFWVITRDSSTPFGPYLSMAVAYVIWDWTAMWGAVSMIMLPPEMLVVFWGVLLVALAGMLGLIEFAKMLRGQSTRKEP